MKCSMALVDLFQSGRDRSNPTNQDTISTDCRHRTHRDLKDYTLYSMKKAGAFEIMDKKSAVVELYDAIQRAVGGIDGKAVTGQKSALALVP
jgi:hypothetical protein